jgi:hypothetical protein
METLSRVIVPASAILQQLPNGTGWEFVGLAMKSGAAELIPVDWTPPKDHDQVDLSWVCSGTCSGEEKELPDPLGSSTFIEVDVTTPCADYPLNAILFHEDPLVLYFPDFVSETEADHLIQVRYVGSRCRQEIRRPQHGKTM